MVTHFLPSWDGLPADRQARLLSALPLLNVAIEDARQVGRDPWEFAITVPELLAAGLWLADLRWLVALGLLAHSHGRTRPRGRRTPRPPGELAISADSCFMLTEAGAQFLSARPGAISLAKSGSRECEPAKPRWDAGLRELSLGGLLVKRFRTPARSQEVILEAFEEEGWPPRIDDPLPGTGGSDVAQQRLHEAVRGLNRGQVTARVHFHRDGTGQGVMWVA